MRMARTLKAARDGVRQISQLLDSRPRLYIPPAPSPFKTWANLYLPHYFTLPPSPFHDWLSGRLDRLRTERGTRLCVLAPRGAAKSTWSTQAYPLYCAIHGLEPYILLTSDTNDQAEGYLRSVRQELEENHALAAAYPHAAGKLATSQQRRIVLRNGVKVEAIGTGGKVRGRKERQHRPSLVIVDDPQNRDHMISEVKRGRSWDWFMRDLMNVGSPQTNYVVLGTALHPDGIVTRLQKAAGWEGSVWKSVVQWPRRMDLWQVWEEILFDWDDLAREEKALAFFEAHRAEMES